MIRLKEFVHLHYHQPLSPIDKARYTFHPPTHPFNPLILKKKYNHLVHFHTFESLERLRSELDQLKTKLSQTQELIQDMEQDIVESQYYNYIADGKK
jgi:hypothetical protein